MPADNVFVRTLVRRLSDRGAQIGETPSTERAPNPFRLSFRLEEEMHTALIHVRRVTPQESEESTHGRPEGEWHMQAIFDGDSGERGTGKKLRLRSQPDAVTCLFGYTMMSPEEAGSEELVVVAWDPSYHEEYGYSSSFQVKEATMLDALEGGLAQQDRATGEIIVVFRGEYLPDYLRQREEWHGTLVSLEGDEVEGEEEIGRVSSPSETSGGERGTTSSERSLRDIRFQTFIRNEYDGCAACELTAHVLLESAHIIPIAEGGSDHFSNGIRLCRNCHRLFDRGMLLIHPSYEIGLSDAMERDFPADAERFRRVLRDELLIPDIPEDYRPDPEKLRRVLEERWLDATS